jgi:protein gp37
MGDKTGIAWCDHTFNPWIGCEKVSEGCVHCYAERDNKRYGWTTGWNGTYRRTSPANWKKPFTWAREAARTKTVRRLFCASLADILDDKIEESWKQELWQVIQTSGEEGAGYLEWLLLTKRHQNIIDLPRSWRISPPHYIRLGVTAENQARANERIPRMLLDWKGKNFISVEPMLEQIVLPMFAWVGNDKREVEWVITGCESGPDRRPMEKDWVRSLLSQCTNHNVPFFLKQMEMSGELTKEPYLDGRQWLEFPKRYPDKIVV